METNYRSEVRSYSRRAVLAGVGGLGVTALAGCLTSGDGDGGDWPMSRATAGNTGYTSATGPVDALEADWEWSFDPEDEEVRNATYSSPVVVGDTVLATCNVVTGTGTDLERSSHLVALEADTGEERWLAAGVETESRRDGPPFSPTPIVVDDTVHVVDPWAQLSFDLEGNERARHENRNGRDEMVPIEMVAPTATGDLLFAPSVRWEPSDDDETHWGLLAIGADGDVEWEFVLDESNDIMEPNVSAAADDETVYVPSRTDLYAVDVDDGTQQWQQRLDDELDGVLFSPVIGDDSVYVSAGDLSELRGGTLSALDPEDGDEQWQFAPDGDSSGVFGSPAWDGETLYITGHADGEFRLFALDPGGSVQWTADVPSIDPSPVVADGVVYVRDSVRENTVAAHDAEDGTKLTDGDLNGNALDPAISHGRYYYGSDDGITALTE